MSKILSFDQAEIANPDDFTAIGAVSRDAFDAVSGGIHGWPAHWARMTVGQKAGYPDTVEISAGEYHAGGKFYTLFNGGELSLQSYKPVISTDERWVALILRGDEVTVDAIRAIETGEEPLSQSVPVNQITPKELRRSVSVVIQQGAISPPPALQPAIAEHDCCVAFVRLTTAGIVQIVSNNNSRVKTIYEIEGRLSVVEFKVDALYSETEALATNLSAMALQLGNIPPRELVRQLTRDMSRMRQVMNFPDEARNYYFDQGLLKDFWEMGHASSLMRIREGVRFQYASQRDQQLRILDVMDPAITYYDNRILLPRYSEAMRIESPLGSGRQDISNTVHTITTANTHTVAHTSIRYGETIFPCENAQGWENLGDFRAKEIFSIGGEEFVSKGKTANPWNQTETAKNGHSEYAVQRVIRDTSYSSYVTYSTQEFGLNGAIFGQTFLNSQLMVVTSIDLYFTRVGATGDVIFSICEVNPSGAPDFDAIIASMTKPQSELAVNAWNKFAFDPTLLEPGKRYAWFTVTTGNHQLAMNTGNTFAGGSKFVSSDGAWAQGSTTEDFSFRLFAAKFDRSRTVVPLESIGTLENGMTEFEMIFRGWEPTGTKLVFEVKAQGDDEWVVMDDRDPNPLKNLPPLVQLRAVFIGTEDVAPMMVFDTYSRVICGRMRNDLRAVSKALPLGFSTDKFQIIVNMDSFDDSIHDFEPKLITVVGGTETVVEADQITLVQDKSKPTRTLFVADFMLGATVDTVRLQLEGASSSVTYLPFVQDTQLNAY